MPATDGAGKRLSGFQQRKKRREEDLSEATAADIRETEAFKRLVRTQKGEDDGKAAATYLRFVAERAGSDPAGGAAARARRQQVTAACQALAKAADPARKIAELTAELNAKNEQIKDLEARLRAALSSRRAGGEPAAAIAEAPSLQ